MFFAINILEKHWTVNFCPIFVSLKLNYIKKLLCFLPIIVLISAQLILLLIK